MAQIHQKTAPLPSTWLRLVLRVLMNALGLWVAARLSRNIDYQDNLAVILVAALIFSLINTFIRPILIILALPAIVLSLGLFMLVINGVMVWLVSALYPAFEVRTFGAAVVAAIIIWIVNFGLSMLAPPQAAPGLRS